MKKILILILGSLSFAACKKDTGNNPSSNYTCTTCTQTSEANQAFDQSSAGVYKGIIVGSSGTIALYLYNTGTEVKALVSFDGRNTTLTTSSLNGWQPGDPVQAALFTGQFDGQTIEAFFSVGANGANPTFTLTIPGHEVVVSVYKETSQTLVKCFEGTYTGDDHGIFNMVFSGSDFSITTDNKETITSSLQNGKVDLNFEGTKIEGSFEGSDLIKGTWKNSENESGTWTAQRTF